MFKCMCENRLQDKLLLVTKLMEISLLSVFFAVLFLICYSIPTLLSFLSLSSSATTLLHCPSALHHLLYTTAYSSPLCPSLQVVCSLGIRIRSIQPSDQPSSFTIPALTLRKLPLTWSHTSTTQRPPTVLLSPMHVSTRSRGPFPPFFLAVSPRPLFGLIPSEELTCVVKDQTATSLEQKFMVDIV